MTRTSKIAAAAATTLVAVLGLVGCGSGGGSTASGSSSPSPVATATSSPSATASSSSSATPTTGTSATATITIKNFAYSTSGTVTAGSTVMITNDDTEAHTVTADAGGFDVTVLPGRTVKLTAPAKGTYRYHCTYHSNMHGTLVVR